MTDRVAPPVAVLGCESYSVAHHPHLPYRDMGGQTFGHGIESPSAIKNGAIDLGKHRIA
jgi:hypothetical protein